MLRLLPLVITGGSIFGGPIVLWQNTLPNSGSNAVAPIYNSPALPDANLMGTPVQPYILGDAFVLSGASTITSLTIYEVGNALTTSTGIPGDNPSSEFSSISLYIGPDGSTTGTGSAVATLSGGTLTSAATQVCFGGACGSGGTNYQSVNNPSNYYAIYAITFSGLNLDLPAGIYDFGIGATPTDSNTFALLMSDPTAASSRNDSNTYGGGNNDFLYYFCDGSNGSGSCGSGGGTGSPLATYGYAPGNGLVANWSSNDPLDADVTINGTLDAPEPGTIALTALGLLGAGLLRRRSRNS